MLRNVTAHARKSPGRFTACAKAHDFSVAAAKRLHWSENSGAFMEGSERVVHERGVVQRVP